MGSYFNKPEAIFEILKLWKFTAGQFGAWPSEKGKNYIDII